MDPSRSVSDPTIDYLRGIEPNRQRELVNTVALAQFIHDKLLEYMEKFRTTTMPTIKDSAEPIKIHNLPQDIIGTRVIDITAFNRAPAGWKQHGIDFGTERWYVNRNGDFIVLSLEIQDETTWVYRGSEIVDVETMMRASGYERGSLRNLILILDALKDYADENLRQAETRVAAAQNYKDDLLADVMKAGEFVD